MAKRPIPKNYNALNDLKGRTRQLIEVNQLALDKGELTDLERAGVEGQQRAFGAVIQLIEMIEHKGSIWKGGYLDSTGIVYTDQIQAILDESQAQTIQAELDKQLLDRLQ